MGLFVFAYGCFLNYNGEFEPFLIILIYGYKSLSANQRIGPLFLVINS